MASRLMIIIMSALLLCHSGSTYAQTWGEWFSQKKTQKKYLIQQIAALQVYIGYVRKGYDIAKKGLNTIGDFSRGELNLFENYFSDLKGASPAIKEYSRVADIISLQVKIVQRFRKDMSLLKGGSSAQELLYLEGVYERLLKDAANILHALHSLITETNLELTDDQRMQRIDQLYKEMQAQYDFTRSFGESAIMLQQQREREARNIGTITNWQNFE